MHFFKHLNRFITLSVLTFYIVSCTKEPTSNPLVSAPEDNIVSYELVINDAAKSYLTQNGERYYESTFDHSNENRLFKFKAKSDKLYRVMISHDGVNRHNMPFAIRNSALDTISFLELDYYGNGLFYRPIKDEVLYVSVELTTEYAENINFQIYVEYLEDEEISLSSSSWQSLGPWEMLNNNDVTITLSNSKLYRRLKLLGDNSNKSKMSFTLSSDNFEGDFPAIGVLLNGSTEMRKLDELRHIIPHKGTIIELEQNNRYRKTKLIDKYSASYSYGQLVMVDLEQGVNFRVEKENNGTKVYINEEYINSAYGAGIDDFYILIKDVGFSTLSIENFLIE
jgi:hypothetical protein